MSVLSIKDLHVAIGDKEILKGINLTINTGETHALMGPNGNGKSTLLGTIMGHPKYKVTQGTITLDGEDVLSMSVDERSRKGLFLGMQYPQEIPGVTNSDFLRSAMNARREKPLSLYQFIKAMDHATEDGSLTVVSNFSLTKSLKTLIISMLLSFFIVKFAKINVLIWANVCYNRHRR